MIQKTKDCFHRARIGHRLHLTHLILIRIQFISITRLISPTFYELSENHVEAHLSEICIFFQMLYFKAWPSNEWVMFKYAEQYTKLQRRVDEWTFFPRCYIRHRSWTVPGQDLKKSGVGCKTWIQSEENTIFRFILWRGPNRGKFDEGGNSPEGNSTGKNFPEVSFMGSNSPRGNSLRESSINGEQFSVYHLNQRVYKKHLFYLKSNLTILSYFISQPLHWQQIECIYDISLLFTKVPDIAQKYYFDIYTVIIKNSRNMHDVLNDQIVDTLHGVQ